jgi:Spy/CpxP family protein refolding chaperone
MAEPPPSTAAAPAEGGKTGPRGNPEVMRERMRRLAGGDGEGLVMRMLTADSRAARELGLTDEQIKQIQEAASGSTQQIRDLNALIEKAALRQAELLKADTLDEAAVLKAVQETGELRTQMAMLRIKQLIVAHKVLTPEQRAKAREMAAQRLQQARQRMQEGGREMPWKGREGRGERQGTHQTPPPPPPPAAAE